MIGDQATPTMQPGDLADESQAQAGAFAASGGMGQREESFPEASEGEIRNSRALIAHDQGIRQDLDRDLGSRRSDGERIAQEVLTGLAEEEPVAADHSSRSAEADANLTGSAARSEICRDLGHQPAQLNLGDLAQGFAPFERGEGEQAFDQGVQPFALTAEVGEKARSVSRRQILLEQFSRRAHSRERRFQLVGQGLNVLLDVAPAIKLLPEILERTPQLRDLTPTKRRQRFAPTRCRSPNMGGEAREGQGDPRRDQETKTGHRRGNHHRRGNELQAGGRSHGGDRTNRLRHGEYADQNPIAPHRSRNVQPVARRISRIMPSRPRSVLPAQGAQNIVPLTVVAPDILRPR